MAGPQPRDPTARSLPARTPGPLGVNDAGDPNVPADTGLTPGPVGVNDDAAPEVPHPEAATAIDGWPAALDWSQFTEIAARPAGSPDAAQTATTQPSIPAITVEHDAQGFRLGPFRLSIALDSSECWVVRGQASAALLRHEQVHWDIGGLTTYELSRRLTALRTSRRAELSASVTSLVQGAHVKGQAVQYWYDDDTAGGTNATQQRVWEDRVAACITGHTALPDPPASFVERVRRELSGG